MTDHIGTGTVGLTGGIASGKSTAASFFRELGVEVVDADEVAREVVSPGEPTLAKIVAAFGSEVLNADGTLARDKLAQTVFSDPEARQRLNALIHPAIATRSIALLAEARRRAAQTSVPYVIYEAPLLIENHIHLGMDSVIVVDISPQMQRSRLATRDGLSDKEIEARLDAQMPVEEKRTYADWLIDNSGDMRRLKSEVRRVHEGLVNQFRHPLT